MSARKRSGSGVFIGYRWLFFWQNRKGKLKMDRIRAEIEKSLKGLPYVFRTSEKREQLDGLSPGVLSNMDAAGQGPTESILIGRKRAYTVPSYVDWLMGRITPVTTPVAPVDSKAV